MNKILFTALLAGVLFAQTAAAQQYVTPIYSQNGGTYGTPSYASSSSQSYYAPQAAAAAPAASTRAAPSGVDLMPLTDTALIPDPEPRFAHVAGIPPSSSLSALSPHAGEAAYDGQDVYAAPRMAASAYNWTGCYAGGYGGGAFGGKSDVRELASQGGAAPVGSSYNLTGSPYSYDNGSGFIGGGTVGCNYEIPERAGALTGLVLGLEGEFGALSTSGSGTDPNSGGVNGDTHDSTKIGDWDGIVAGRVGAAFDRTFVYGKFGAVFTNAKSNITDTCTTGSCGGGLINANANKQITDAAIGGGVEYALTNAWSIKGEYMYLDTTDSLSVCGAGGGSVAGSNYCSQHDLNGTHTVKIGLNYHFNDLFSGLRSGPRW